jgi:uncharacterized protein YndB with AHSA1/START domain
MADSERQVVMELDLEATLEDAWRALTDARELARWFPLSARVDGRAGGAVVWEWADRFQWATRIEVWDPPRRLRLVQDVERPHDVSGRPLEDRAIPATRIAMDFTLETRRGKTWLRLVHSGFGLGAAWDDELDGVRNGWAFELRSLAHYVARHRGRDRYVGWGIGSSQATHAALWQRLLGSGGFPIEAEKLAAGEPYALRTPEGDRLTGVICVHVPERTFAGTVRELDDGLIRLESWSAGGATGVNVWLATWSATHAARVRQLGSAARDFLDRHWGAATLLTTAERKDA